MMRKGLFARFCGICLFASLLFSGYAQSWTQEVKLAEWRTVTEEMASGKVVRYLFFETAFLEKKGDQLVPCWQGQWPCPEGERYRITLSEERWEALSEAEKACLPLAVLDTLSAQYSVSAVVTRRQPMVEVRVWPLRKRNGTYEKLRSFRLSGFREPVPDRQTGFQKTYVPHSVLASGEIYKVALSGTGVYKLTYSLLERMGVNMNGLNIRTISVYGNGGYQLPENTHEEVPDDIQEIPLKVVDADGDGIFDAEDYLLFYARGIVEWKAESAASFVHTLNIYSDYAYYFIKINQAPAKTLETLSSVSATPTHVLTSYRYHGLLEEDLLSPTGVGRLWFKDLFDAVTSRTYAFSLPELTPSSKVDMLLRLAVSSPSYYSYFSYQANGGDVGSIGMRSGNGEVKSAKYTFTPSSPSFSLTLNYSKPSNTSKAWLDYIEVNASCLLRQYASQVDFRCPEAVGAGNVAEYRIQTLGRSPEVWDVTDPYAYRKVETSQDGGVLSFRLPSDNLREFVSFYGSDLPVPSPIGRAANQDLHAAEATDLVILTPPVFLSYAEQLAELRRSNDRMRVLVVTTSQVYQEFGSGAQDIAAIRNFMRMLYDRYPSDPPKNLLLFGKVSYDFRNRKGMGTCYIPNYQAENVFNVDECLSTDDFFVKLDDYEGYNNKGSMDVGIGRLPVSNAEQAATVVQKLRQYASMDLLNDVKSNNVSNLAEWRNMLVFCADDDEDAMGHLFNADRIAIKVAADYPVYNIEKIYMDAYKKVSTSQGQRFPEATEALNQRVNKGCLFMTYMGHGGDNGLAHERFLKRSDISSWTNRYNFHFFYAGSCSFGEYDKLASVSPSEDMLFKADGGAIGVISASRSSYGGTNEAFGMQLLTRALATDSNSAHLTMGEVFAMSKNRCGSVEMYILFGDPSMTLAFPKTKVKTDSVNGSAQLHADTLQALSYVTVSGHVCAPDGSIAQDFNGYVYPTVYDKATTVSTLLNNSSSVEKTFKLQKNILYKGKISVSNGRFRFSFLLPKDINYEYGSGKISYYAYGNKLDANGYDTVTIGGAKDTLISDNHGPEIKLYLNDETFVSGGVTGDSPTLLAEISDENGVNTAGIGIGHDLVAVLDQQEGNPIVLNDYYECEENSSLSGRIRYLLSGLSEGEHCLSLRAWDVLNNRSEATLSFTVMNPKDMVLDHVLNYPNPFTTRTQFYFEHNQINTMLEVRIQVFTVSGKLVKTILHTEFAESFRCGPMEWDGKDDFGGRLAKGTYLYKLSVRTGDGRKAEKIEKLVLL